MRFLESQRPDFVLPQERDHEATYSVQRKIGGEQHPIRLQSVTKLPHDEQCNKVPEHLIGYYGLDWYSHTVRAAPGIAVRTNPVERKDEVRRDHRASALR